MKCILAAVMLLSALAFPSCKQGGATDPSALALMLPLYANDWTNPSARAKYKNLALDICNAFSPVYLGLAIEVNTYYHYHPADFGRFSRFYRDVYDSVKACPNCASTKVFVTFQLERMKGLGTAVGYPGTPQWEILGDFGGRLDLIVFTSYPETEYADPADIPDDYYSGIVDELPAELSGKKIALSEIGWNSGVNLLAGSSNDYKSQVGFITRVATLTNPLKDEGRVEFVCWAFMHDFRDTGAFDPFRTIGLRNSDGTQKGPGDEVRDQWIFYKDFIGPAYGIGVGPVPRNFPGSDGTDWLDMYQQVPELGTLLLAQTDWRDSVDTAGEIPRLFVDMTDAAVYHQADLVFGINFFDLATGEAIIHE